MLMSSGVTVVTAHASLARGLFDHDRTVDIGDVYAWLNVVRSLRTRLGSLLQLAVRDGDSLGAWQYGVISVIYLALAVFDVRPEQAVAAVAFEAVWNRIHVVCLRLCILSCSLHFCGARCWRAAMDARDVAGAGNFVFTGMHDLCFWTAMRTRRRRHACRPCAQIWAARTASVHCHGHFTRFHSRASRRGRACPCCRSEPARVHGAAAV